MRKSSISAPECWWLGENVERGKTKLWPSKNARAEPDQGLPQGFIADVAGNARRRSLGGFIDRQDRRLARGRERRNRALHQDETRDAMPAKIGVDTLDDNRGEMLQFERAGRLDAHNERRPGRAIVHWAAAPRGPLHLDRPGHCGEPFADNFVPVEYDPREAKSAPCQHGINGRPNELAKRL
jgi:hypothetical protein